MTSVHGVTDTMTVLKPIETKGKTAADVDTILKQCRDAMLEALHDMARDNRSKMESKVLEKKQT